MKKIVFPDFISYKIDFCVENEIDVFESKAKLAFVYEDDSVIKGEYFLVSDENKVFSHTADELAKIATNASSHELKVRLGKQRRLPCLCTKSTSYLGLSFNSGDIYDVTLNKSLDKGEIMHHVSYTLDSITKSLLLKDEIFHRYFEVIKNTSTYYTRAYELGGFNLLRNIKKAGLFVPKMFYLKAWFNQLMNKDKSMLNTSYTKIYCPKQQPLL